MYLVVVVFMVTVIMRLTPQTSKAITMQNALLHSKVNKYVEYLFFSFILRQRSTETNRKSGHLLYEKYCYVTKALGPNITVTIFLPVVIGTNPSGGFGGYGILGLWNTGIHTWKIILKYCLWFPKFQIGNATVIRRTYGILNVFRATIMSCSTVCLLNL